MVPTEYRKTQIYVALLALLALLASAFILVRLGTVSPKAFFILGLAGAFIIAHWWLLGTFVGALAGRRGFVAGIWGLMALFPFFGALATVYAAAKTDRSFLIPAGLGIGCVPAAATLFCLAYGISGFRGMIVRKGSVHD